MKSLFAISIIQLFFVPMTFAGTPLVGEWYVSKTSCLSGAPVNTKETISVGTKLNLSKKDFKGVEYTFSYVGDKVNLIHLIEHEGNDYTSGNPPCPTNDKLIIEFSQK